MFKLKMKTFAVVMVGISIPVNIMAEGPRAVVDAAYAEAGALDPVMSGSFTLNSESEPIDCGPGKPTEKSSAIVQINPDNGEKMFPEGHGTDKTIETWTPDGDGGYIVECTKCDGDVVKTSLGGC